MSSGHSLDAVIRRYWEGGCKEVVVAREVVSIALAHPPRTPTVLARALTVAQRANATGYAARVTAELAGPMARTRKLLALLDAVGDDTIDANQAVFDGLAGWVADGSLAGLDVRPISNARRGAKSRAHAARALLDGVGWERLDDELAFELRSALDALERSTSDFNAWVLVVAPEHDVGLTLGINVLAGDGPGVVALDAVDIAMEKQARTVLSAVAAERNGVKWSLEWPLNYAGESVGLGLHVAALVRFKGLRPDPLLAATGAVADDGRVGHVEGVPAKLAAARDAGFRRVLLPRENEDEAHGAGVADDLQLVFVGHVDEIPARLNEVTLADELSYDGRVRLGRASLSLYGLSLKDEKSTQHSRQLVVTDAAGKAILEIWSSGTVKASGPAGATRDQVQQLIAEVFAGEPAKDREPQGFMLDDAYRQKNLREGLEREGAQEREAKGNGELFRYVLRRKSSEAQLTMWTSGKGRLTGKAPAFDEVCVLLRSAQEGLANADVVAKPKTRGPAGGSSPADLPKDGPWIGTDESGKGDYFGPLVSAAVYADDEVAEQLRSIGVKDSKQLTDRRVRALAPRVREAVGNGRYKVTPLNPPRYNALYAEFKAEGKNLNSLLAWGHTRSIEDLLAAGLRPRYAIVDQFADARYIEQRLMAGARKSGLKVFQFPKAEENIAVAAASILAREAFLDWLERTSAKIGLTLPKGASPQVIEVARNVAASGGRKALAEVAKLHFKTTEKVLAS